MQEYPLLDEVYEHLKSRVNLRRTRLIACQHLLGPQYAMFERLFALGLQPRNCVVIGKNYSAHAGVTHKLQQRGCIVAPFSTTFDAHQPFDDWFLHHLRHFVPKHVAPPQLSWPRVNRYVVLDDGGMLHEVCNTLDQRILNRTAGVEQTMSGYNRFKGKALAYDITWVARSWHKVRLEPGHIARHAIERIATHLAKRGKAKARILVFGLGAIGRTLAMALAQHPHYDVKATDSDYERVAEETQWLRNAGCLVPTPDAYTALHEYDVVIGATGTQLFDTSMIDRLHPQVSLMSVSSSDREFPAVAFRASGGGVHDNYWLGERCLVNGGFPITFQGNEHEVPAQHIELTVASLLLATGAAAAPAGQINLPLATQQLVELSLMRQAT